MNSVRQFTDQFQETFASMPLSSRITTGLLAILVLIGLGFVVRTDRRPENEMLFGGRSLSEQELDSVEMSFSQAGLNAWKREGHRISIPVESRSEYLSALSSAASLPVSIRSSVQDAIEKTTFLESSSQRLAREMHAKEQDLGNKLTAFPEIRWASVEYDLGEREGLGRDRQQTVSVMVCPEGGRALSRGRIEDIKKFIGGSYAGMSTDDVVVIDTHIADAEHESDPTLASQSPVHQRQLAEQARIEQQVSELLADYGAVRVAAFVEFVAPNTDQFQVPQPVIGDDEPAGLTSEDASAITQVRSNRATSLRQPILRSENKQSASQALQSAQDSPQQIAQQIVRGIPPINSTLARACVSIGLPQSYYQRLWNHLYRQRAAANADRVAPPPTSAQLDQLRQQTQNNIRAAVTPALLSAAPHQPTDSMVQIYDFPDLLTSDAMPGDFRTVATAWLSVHWQQVALLVVAFVGLSLALRMLGNAPSTSQVNRPLAGQVTPQSAAKTVDVPHSQPATGSYSATDSELLAMIQQDPDAAVDVIRGWIGEAA